MAGWVESRFRDWMKSVERRLSTMETQQRLFNASVKGGAIVVYNDSTQQVTRMGQGSYGSSSGTLSGDIMAVSTPGGQFHQLIDTTRGWVRPIFGFNFSKEDNFNVDSSGTAFSCWKATTTVFTKCMEITIVCYPHGGANGELWLDLDNGLHTTNHVTINNAAGQTTDFKWDLSSLGYVFGQTTIIRVYCQVTNATGSIDVATPDGSLWNIIENLSGATSAGGV